MIGRGRSDSMNPFHSDESVTRVLLEEIKALRCDLDKQRRPSITSLTEKLIEKTVTQAVESRFDHFRDHCNFQTTGYLVLITSN
jgi:hypothetical protein